MRSITLTTGTSILSGFSTSTWTGVSLPTYYSTIHKTHYVHCRYVFISIPAAVDVNVTPDKRKIFLDYESYLLATIKVKVKLFPSVLYTILAINIFVVSIVYSIADIAGSDVGARGISLQ